MLNFKPQIVTDIQYLEMYKDVNFVNIIIKTLKDAHIFFRLF